jgi:hypothetical protein
MTILKLTGRTYCNRITHYRNKGIQILVQPSRKTGGSQETLKYLLITGIGQSKPVELIGLHKLIKNIGTKYYCSRYGYQDIGIFAEKRFFLKY